MRELPQLFKSRLTCDGGGATTACCGSASLGAERSRAGAETGGAITSTACATVARELAKSCGVACGAGATTFIATGLAERSLSRATSGAGATSVGFIDGVLRVLACVTSGAGGATLVDRLWPRLSEARNSGEGGTGFMGGSSGALSFERMPSVGGGPGFGLMASRFATAESLRGRLILGASTTVSVSRSPRATRMACER